MNTPELANRFVSVGRRKYPILHLGIGKLESFRSSLEKYVSILTQIASLDGMSLETFCRTNSAIITAMLTEDVPYAAAIALGIDEAELRRTCHPLDLLRVVVEQWHHNGEIADIQEAFPYPPDDDNPPDLNKGNPLTIVERLASAYHWPFEEAIKRTLPQVYLMGVSAAWSYKQIEDKHEGKASGRTTEHPKLRRSADGGIVFEGKTYKTLRDMPSTVYRRYFDSMLRG